MNLKNITGLSFAVIVTLLTGCSSTPKAPIVINEKYRSLIEVENLEQPSFGSNKIKINAKITPRLFLIVPDEKGETLQVVYNNFKSKLSAKGFVIVDKVEEADLGLVISTIGDYMQAANDNGVASSLSGDKVAGHVGAALATGGLSLVGELFNSKERAVLMTQIIKSPVLADAKEIKVYKKYKTKDGSDFIVSTQVMDFKRGGKTPAVSFAIVDTIFDGWMTEHIADI